MRLRSLLLLACLQALILLGVAAFQPGPGYMDAEYYAVMGRRLATGQGAREPFLWNYLEDPQGVPHPAFAYWAPLSAGLAAGGLRLWTSGGYAAARLPFLALGILLPPLTALLAWRATRRRALAWLAGALAVTSGYYLPYWPVTETFAPTAVLGALLWLGLLAWEEGASKAAPSLANLAPSEKGGEAARWEPQAQDNMASLRLVGHAALLGAVVAGLHLTRNEGLLWLVVAAGVLGTASSPRRRLWAPLAALLAGYLLGYAPRWLYNLSAWGRLTPPGVERTLWLTTYNDLFAFPAAVLTPQRWWAQGWEGLWRNWAWALRRNLLTLWAVQGQIVALPFVLVGAWRLRHRPTTRWALAGWALLLGALTLIFPFAGARGGFFHAGAALQPLLWVWAAVGLEASLRLAARYRKWPWPQAGWVLGGGLVAVLALFSTLVVTQRVLGPHPEQPAWTASERRYARLAQALAQRHPASLPPVLINNPPGWAWVTHDAPSLVIPNGGPQTARAVAQRYGATWMVLEPNHPPALDDLYARPRDVAGWRYVTTVDKAHLFALEEAP